MLSRDIVSIRHTVVAVALVVAMTGEFAFVETHPARAANVNEFNFEDAREVSHQASAGLLNGISQTFQALARAEVGDVQGANGRKSEAIALLRSSREGFQRIVNEMKERKIDYKKLSSADSLIAEVFQRRGYRVPQTTKDLAVIALREIDLYLAAVERLELGDPKTSRPALLRVNDELHRLMELGIFISELADVSS